MSASESQTGAVTGCRAAVYSRCTDLDGVQGIYEAIISVLETHRVRWI